MSTISTSKQVAEALKRIGHEQNKTRRKCFWCENTIEYLNHEKCASEFKQAILSLLKPRKR